MNRRECEHICKVLWYNVNYSRNPWLHLLCGSIWMGLGEELGIKLMWVKFFSENYSVIQISEILKNLVDSKIWI